MTRIAHLSDLHFGAHDERLVQAVDQQMDALKPDLVVISGDLTRHDPKTMGDSGGPIFNDRRELAGVLFGAGEGTTLGSFAPRVSAFLASLAPDIGQARDQSQVAVADRPAPNDAAVRSTSREMLTQLPSGAGWALSRRALRHSSPAPVR